MNRIPYANAVGAIMYTMTCTRPDVAYALGVTSRYQADPGEEHWKVVKTILKYLRRTKDQFLIYGDSDLKIEGYTDASFASDKDDSKSISGYVFTLNGGAVSSKSSKQATVADSVTEAEYIAASEAAKEAVWMKKFISELSVVPSIEESVPLLCDNTGAIAQAKEARSHQKSKHGLRRYHLIRALLNVETSEFKRLMERKMQQIHSLKHLVSKSLHETLDLGNINSIPNTDDYLWTHGAISDETLSLERTVCNDSTYMRLTVRGRRSQGCDYVFSRVSDEIGADVEHDDLLLPKCLSSSSAQFRPLGLHGKIHAAIARRANIGDPCLPERIFTYLNRPDVQKALHANTTHLPYLWHSCSGPLQYQQDNLDLNIIPLVLDILKEGIPILLFSGDQDSLIPLTQTRTIANILAKDAKLLTMDKYGPWYDGKQVGGWSQSFGEERDGKNVTSLTYATVRGAAHEVPFSSPSQALTLFLSFLKGSALPRPHA
ncbi:hypothetical protein RJ640_010831 [Escallonia rubra]|uniref:Uncharacterized protein n=1 Tax=Escallonia rubra TaxID=112253 RepID=A0AA88QKK3_9ASTE|nr:hypothetical protein RJ640_010831 [Escallonia rubra]